MEELMTTRQLDDGRQRVTPDLYMRFIAFLDSTPKTAQTYTRALRQLFAYFADNGIVYPTRDDIIAFRENLKSTGHKPATIQLYITATRLFFQWTEQEHIYPNVAAHIKGAKLDRAHKKDYLTSAQVKTILGCIERNTLKGKRDYAMLALAITGGLRTIELARANVGDMRTVADSTVLFVQGKGREEKTEYVKLDTHVEAALRDYLKARGNRDQDAPLFASTSHNNSGERMTTRAISGTIKGRMVNAGYDSPTLTAHSTRHTAVTLALLAGRPLEEVQQFARHANISTTLIYSHALDQATNGCSAAIANSIF